VRNIAKSLDPDDVVFLQDILHQFKWNCQDFFSIFTYND
jgi:hypothetical protein